MDRHSNYTFFVGFALFLLSACNPTTPQADQAATDWSITLDISGGFAGLMQTLTLDQSGQGVLIDQRKKSRIEKQVTGQDLRTYAELVKNLADASHAKSLPDQCRDCINYSLTVRYDSTVKRRAVNNLTLADSDAKQLLTRLMSLVTQMKTQDRPIGK
jgi:hypothetical protein